MKKLISAVALASVIAAGQLAAVTSAQAAPQGPGHQPPPQVHVEDKGGMFQPKKGKKLPNTVKRQVIKERDYKRFGLKRPPHGYQWVKVGDRFLMVAITTGVIFSILGAIANQH